jgi:hypothetical protein
MNCSTSEPEAFRYLKNETQAWPLAIFKACLLGQQPILGRIHSLIAKGLFFPPCTTHRRRAAPPDIDGCRIVL